ncbi:MAG: hypothetical protein AB8H80_15120 [Planctomycetota bacterium]
MTSIAQIARIALLASAPLLAQQSPFARLPSNATTVFYCGDLVAASEKVIDAPEIQKLMKALDPALRGVVGMPLEAKRIKARISLLRDMIPKQIAFACPEGTTNTLLSTLQASVLAVMLKQAVQHGAKNYEAEVRAGLTSALGAMEGVDAVCILTMANERAAESTLKQLTSTITKRFGAGADAVRDDGIVDIVVAPMKRMAPAILELLQSHRIEVPKLLTDGFPLRLIQSGAEIVITVGQPKAGPLDTSIVGDLWDDEQPPLILSQTTATVHDDAVRLRQLAAGSSNLPDLIANAIAIERFCRPQAYALHVGKEVRFQSESKVYGSDKSCIQHTAAIARTAPPGLNTSRLSWGLFETLHTAIGLAEAFGGNGPSLANRLPKLLAHLRERNVPWQDRGMVLLTNPDGAAVVLPMLFDEAYFCAIELMTYLQQDLGLPEEILALRDLGLGQETLIIDLGKISPALAKGLDKELVLHFAGEGNELVISTDADLSKKIFDGIAKGAISDNVTLDVHLDGDEARSCFDQVIGCLPKHLARSRAIDAIRALLARFESLEGTGTADQGAQRECWRLNLR